MSKYLIKIELPDNETIKECIKTDEVRWTWHGYSGSSKAVPLHVKEEKNDNRNS